MRVSSISIWEAGNKLRFFKEINWNVKWYKVKTNNIIFTICSISSWSEVWDDLDLSSWFDHNMSTHSESLACRGTAGSSEFDFVDLEDWYNKELV